MTTTIVDTPVDTGATQNNAAPAEPTPAITPVAAAPVVPAAQPSTVIDPVDPTVTPDAAGKWPEDWRDQFAKGDEKALKQFARYASPEAMADALLAAQKRISQGELGVKKPGKDAKPEEIAAYRASIGVPDKPETYFENLPNGLVIGDNDKPLFDKFASLMHEDNVPTGTMQKVVDWYYKEVVEEGEQQRYEMNKEAKQATEDALRQEYGPEYRAQVNGITNLLSSLPDGAGELLANAVGADGISLFNNPAVIRAMVHLVNEVNPTASVIPGGSSPQAMADRKSALKEIMSTDRARWFKEPALQEEYQRIVKAEEKLQARG